jgi:DNA-binding IclR family transcriptional regulator
MRAEYRIDAVRNAVRLLRALAESGRPLGVTELGKMLGMNKASVFRLLLTLGEQGFVRQDPRTRAYGLGPELVVIGQAAAESLHFRRDARSLMEKLTAATEMPSFLNVPGSDQVVCVEHVPSMRLIDLYGRAGHTMLYHACPSGLVLLAYGPPERLEAVIERGLARISSQTITDPEELRLAVAQVREQGYAVGVNDLDEGVASISAPIYGADGQVVAALGLAGFLQHVEGRIDPLVDQLLSVTRELSMPLYARSVAIG